MKCPTHQCVSDGKVLTKREMEPRVSWIWRESGAQAGKGASGSAQQILQNSLFLPSVIFWKQYMLFHRILMNSHHSGPLPSHLGAHCRERLLSLDCGPRPRLQQFGIMSNVALFLEGCVSCVRRGPPALTLQSHDLGCHNRIPQTGWLTHRHLFS